MLRRFLFGLSLVVGGVFVANAGTVSGTVAANAAAGGAAIAGAIVTLTPTAAGGTTYIDTTSAAGAYDFAAVATGAYRLTAAATGYTTSAAFAVVVTAASATVHNFALAAAPVGATVSGTVTDASNASAIDGAEVYLRTGATTTIVDSTTTAAGAYSFADVAAGEYNLEVIASGYTTYTSAEFAVAAANVTRNIALDEVGTGVTVSGAVTNATTGAAIVGAVVRIENSTTDAVVETTTTIAGGAYSLTTIAAGEYILTASATGENAYTSAAFAVAAVNLTRNFTMTTATAVTVSGAVTNATTGAAIVGAVVRLENSTTDAVVESTTTIAGGAYSLTGVAAGEYILHATATGDNPYTSAAFAVAAANVVRNFTMTTAVTVTVSGYVTDTSSGAGIVGATVELESGTTVVTSATTTTGGAYTLTGVDEGTYSLVVIAAGYATKTTALTVTGVNITTENIRIVKSTAVVPVAETATLAKPDFTLTSAGVLHLVNCTRAGLITLFSVDGKCVYRTTFGAMESSVAVPHGIVRSGSTYIVSVTQGSSVYRKQVMLF
jgi:hypothetical protein